MIIMQSVYFSQTATIIEYIVALLYVEARVYLCYFDKGCCVGDHIFMS